MKSYTVDRPVTLDSGVIGLSDAQAAVRRHCLARLARGRYRITRPVQFKAGEMIGLEEINLKLYAGWLTPAPGRDDK